MTSSNTANRLRHQLAFLDRLPATLRVRVLGWLLHRVIPFTGTAGLEFPQLSSDGVVVRLRNRRRVRNHIGGVHAAATALLAETASGLALGMHLPDDKLPLLKSMNIQYLKRARGGLRAQAVLTDAQVHDVHALEKGDAAIRVRVTDEDNQETVDCVMTWAWIPRKR